jgi:hypothetical protein
MFQAISEARVCKLEGTHWNLHEKVKVVRDGYQGYRLDFGQKEAEKAAML